MSLAIFAKSMRRERFSSKRCLFSLRTLSNTRLILRFGNIEFDRRCQSTANRDANYEMPVKKKEKKKREESRRAMQISVVELHN